MREALLQRHWKSQGTEEKIHFEIRILIFQLSFIENRAGDIVLMSVTGIGSITSPKRSLSLPLQQAKSALRQGQVQPLDGTCQVD
jgi:hypothetical protein